MKSLNNFRDKIKNKTYPKFNTDKFNRCKPIIEKYQKEFNIPEESAKDLFQVLDSTTIYSLILNNVEKQLIFIGALHVKRQPNSKWFLDILDDVVLKYDPDSTLIESSSDRTKFIAQEPEKDEGSRAIYLANKLKIPVKGMDAKKEKMFGVFVEHNLIDAGIFIWLNNSYIYEITAKNREEALKKSVDILYEDLTKGWFSNYLTDVEKLMKPDEELKGAILRLAQEAVEKYINSNSNLISALENKDAYPPFPHTDKYLINLIKALWGEERDNSMINICVNELNIYNNVFAIAGMGHIQVIRQEIFNKLKEEFPEYVIEYQRYIDILNI